MVKAYMKRLHRYLVIIILINSGLLPLKSLPSNYEINKNNETDKKQLVHKDVSSKRPNIFLSNKGDQNKLELSDLGKQLVIKQKLIKNTLRFLITGDISKYTTESFSRPNEGIELVLIKPNKEFLEVDILFSDYIDLSTINIQKKSDDIYITYKKGEPKIVENKDIFKIKKIFNNEAKTPSRKASAPPLGDIATGTTIIPNPNLLDLEGPNISLVFKETPAKKAIQFLLSKSNYSFVWVQNDPSYDSSTPSLNPITSPTGTSSGISNPGTSLNSIANNQVAAITGPTTQGSEEDSKGNPDSPRLITLSIENKSFSTAFNSVLIASGLQARKVDEIIFVGPNVRDTAFTERISKVYRLNQTTANAAASYLANLGAKVTRTSSITTAVSTGATESSSVGASSSTTSSGESTTVQVYGSEIGPLVGLIATTDDRLQSVTLIGSNDLINIAEGFLKKLDLRQRQVAISIKVLDVNLKDGSGLSNSWSFKQNNNFIVNDQGKLLGAFGSYLPPNEATDFSDDNTGKIYTEDTTQDPAIFGYSRQYRERLNPGTIGLAGETDENFVNFLRAEITSENTKILASPTIILNEYPGETGGSTVTFSDISEILKTGSIGRAFGNEGFVIVGTQVPINCTSEGDSSVPSFSYGLAGLTFGARVLGIDDNGFVTFAISPAVSASAGQRNITGCGEIDLLSIRRLDTGNIRVRNGNTLILTGVLNTEDKETVSKFPFFGDIPLIGQFFRNTATEQARRELVILVTPQILEDSGQYNKNLQSTYKPASPEAREFLNN
jgi:type IV pilus assembly protein PilQ